MIGTAAQDKVSRRSFLNGAVALAFSHGFAAAQQVTENGRVLAYVGTYTGASGRVGNGEGIELFEVNPHTGELKWQALGAKTPNPSWIVIHPTKKYLYAVNEVDDFEGRSGSVSAFVIDPAHGTLSLLNMVNSEGAGPAYLSLDAAGRFAFVANYAGGSISVLPIRGDGSLGAAVDVHRDHGAVGAKRAANAPTGSFAISGHDAPHAHMIAADLQNRFVLAADLGQDRIYSYRFDRETGKLSAPPGAPFVSLPSGDGPRHFAIHPGGRWFYSVQEEASTVVFFDYDPDAGKLDAQQTVSALPPGFAGTSFASAIVVTPDGTTVYALNRLHDTVAMFAVGADGRLRFLGEISTMGDYPVQCQIGPGGDFLYVCNQRSDDITTFRIDRDTGLLAFQHRYTAVGTPGSITFLA